MPKSSSLRLGRACLTHGYWQRLPGTNELADRGGQHLPHDVAAVGLPRPIAAAEIEGDRLVGATARNLVQDLTLTRRQRFHPFDIAFDNQGISPLCKVSLDAGDDGFQRRLI